MDWWEQLVPLNKVLYGAAAFFSVFFVWQLIAAFIGLDAGEDTADADGSGDVGDVDHDATYDDFEHGAETDSGETVIAFRLLSLRSIVAFGTLFSWAGAMYMHDGKGKAFALGVGFVWGLVGMLCVAGIFYGMQKLTKTGTADLSTCVGTRGSVYVTIPENGVGEIRVMVSGSVSYVKARAWDGKRKEAGTPVRVSRRLDQITVEVEEVEPIDDL